MNKSNRTKTKLHCKHGIYYCVECKNKQIKYKIDFTCEINRHGSIIPTGFHYGAFDEKGEHLNLVETPDLQKLLIIWLGQYYSYPNIKETK